MEKEGCCGGRWRKSEALDESCRVAVDDEQGPARKADVLFEGSSLRILLDPRIIVGALAFFNCWLEDGTNYERT